MKNQSGKLTISAIGIVAFCLTVAWSAQQSSAPTTVPVTITVSVEAKHGKDIPAIYREDVRVFHDHDRLKVTNWVPLQGAQSELELFLLIDDSTDSTLGLQFDDLKKFIATQPETTSIAIGYIRNGTVNVAQNFTKDKSLLDKALRLPQGFAAGDASPYLAVHDLIDRWPAGTNNRREIFLISSGIDALQPGPTDTYLDQTIERARRADVQVYCIYASRTGHLGHTMWQATQGQSNLSRLADETGAEAYFQALEMPISFAPYLNEFADRLRHQYRLTFESPAGKKTGFEKIRLETEVPNAELVAMESVYVPGAR